MSRSSKSNLIVRDDGIELLLGLSKTGNVVKNDFRFLVLLRTFRNANLDRVDHSQRTVPVINDFDRIVYVGYYNGGHIRPIIAVNGFCTAAPDKQSALDGHIVQHNFTIRRAAADDEIAVHGHVLERYIVGANQGAALNILVIGSFGSDISADDVEKICANSDLVMFSSGARIFPRP